MSHKDSDAPSPPSGAIPTTDSNENDEIVRLTKLVQDQQEKEKKMVQDQQEKEKKWKEAWQEERRKRIAAEQTAGKAAKAMRSSETPIRAVGEPVVEATDRAERTEQVRNAFRQPYVGDLDPLLLAEIGRLLRAYDKDTDLSPFVTFFQSSGWGKTRFFAELAQQSTDFSVVYLHIPATGSNGYPSPTPLQHLKEVLAQRYENETSQVQAWSSLLLRIVASALDVKPDQLWRTYYEDGAAGLQYTTAFTKALDEHNPSTMDKQGLDGAVIVVVDEAGRMGVAENGIEHWRALRRALRDVSECSEKLRVLGIAVATVSAGSQLHPSRHSDPSLRDSLAEKVRFTPLSGLTSNLDIVALGRPLWIQFDSSTSTARTVFAAEKLLCSSPIKELSDYENTAKCAMTLSRAPFVLPHLSAGVLVGSHMATVLEVGKKGESFRAGYVSDTYLARGAAFAVRHTAYTFDARLTDICTIFSKSVHNNGSAGDVGELGVCMVLLEAMDVARLSLESDYKLCFSKSPSVKLRAFLVALFTHPVDVSDFHPDLNSDVNFNHFTRVYNSDCLVDPEFVAKLWEREAGVLCPPGYPGVDIMIPALHTSSKSTHRFFFWLMFQAKNYNDSSSVPISAMAPQEHRFVKPPWPGVTEVTCGGLYFLLNLRGRKESRLTVTSTVHTQKVDNVSYKSRCVRVPDRSFLRPLEGCEQEWERLMALHRYGDNLSASFKRDESIKAEMFHTAIPKIDTATRAPGT